MIKEEKKGQVNCGIENKRRKVGRRSGQKRSILITELHSPSEDLGKS